MIREAGEKEEVLGDVSHRRPSQQSEEVLVQRRRAAVDQQKTIGPLQRRGQLAGRGGRGGGVALLVLRHVEDGGEHRCFKFQKLLLQHQ